MRNIIITTALLLWSIVQADEKIEIMAEDLSATETMVVAKGNVVVHYDDSVIQSSMATYNRESHILTLSGKDVELFGYKGSKIESETLKINTQSKIVTFKNVFLTDSNDIWIYADRAAKKDDNMTFGPSIMSSCDINNKDWTLYSGSSQYDKKEHYMTMRDVKMKFWDVPVFYTPYLAFSTHRERSSGLLFPSIGYSKTDGAVYEQPIYWAASESWDVEFRPQYRSKRGYGGYATIRFADSLYSQGAMRIGYFKDKPEYVEENDIRNESHYGLQLFYNSYKLLGRFMDLSDDVVDGLYINTTLLNDIDYIYLQKSPLGNFGASPLQQSKLNYFIHNEDYSAGVFAKYFVDTTKAENDTTMQILPTVQLHKYLKSLLLDQLTYSVDLTMDNYTRQDGATLKVAEFYTPIEYTHAFFNDYLTLSLKEDIHYNKLIFGDGEFAQNDYQYYNGVSRLNLYSDLTKKYDSFVHVIQPSISYNIPSNAVETPVAFEELDDEEKKLYAPGLEEKNIAFNFSQYLYDDDGKLVFYERLTQFYHPDNEKQQLDDMAHEMQYNEEEWEFYNTFIYSYEFNKIKQMSSSIRWRKNEYGLSLTHTYQRLYNYNENEEVVEQEKYNSVNLDVAYKLTSTIGLVGGFVYDIDKALESQWKLGINYNRDCWNVAFSMRQDVRPTETSQGSDSVIDNSFGIQINFVPFGGIGVSSNDAKQYQ